MRVLLVNPAFPETYWSLTHMLPFVGRRWLVAPLSLASVAALLPRDWDLRVVDLCFEALSDEELARADLVLLSGMLVQKASLRETLGRCRRLGVRTVVGGPCATAVPEELAEADHLVLGEAEELLPALAPGLADGTAPRVSRATRRPELASVPVPRFDLLDRDAYHYQAVQFSRGCPFTCEFCDIIEMYGRRPRTKAPEQVVAELEALRATGFAGRVMFVDDNFVGDPRATRRLLRELAAWRRRSGAPFDFFTQASVNLADDPELVDLMTEAGFAVVFLGIETPSAAALAETRKLQNLRRDQAAQVRDLRRRGLDVWAGFILGFDSDGPDIFDRMIHFVEDAGIAYAMVGQLIALPGTPLHRRLAGEGRLRPGGETGDMFALTNVVTKLPAEELVAGYTRVLETLYDPARYFARCREHLRHWRPPAGLSRPASLAELPVVWRSLRTQGLSGPYRREYWRFLAWVLRHDPRKLPLALAQACAGHHFLTYTRETAVPALHRALDAGGGALRRGAA